MLALNITIPDPESLLADWLKQQEPILKRSMRELEDWLKTNSTSKEIKKGWKVDYRILKLGFEVAIANTATPPSGKSGTSKKLPPGVLSPPLTLTLNNAATWQQQREVLGIDENNNIQPNSVLWAWAESLSAQLSGKSGGKLPSADPPDPNFKNSPPVFFELALFETLNIYDLLGYDEEAEIASKNKISKKRASEELDKIAREQGFIYRIKEYDSADGELIFQKLTFFTAPERIQKYWGTFDLFNEGFEVEINRVVPGDKGEANFRKIAKGKAKGKIHDLLKLAGLSEQQYVKEHNLDN